MGRRTNQTQRKVRMPRILKRRSKEPSVDVKPESTDGATCQITGCGCGN